MVTDAVLPGNTRSTPLTTTGVERTPPPPASVATNDRVTSSLFQPLALGAGACAVSAVVGAAPATPNSRVFEVTGTLMPAITLTSVSPGSSSQLVMSAAGVVASSEMSATTEYEPGSRRSYAVRASSTVYSSTVPAGMTSRATTGAAGCSGVWLTCMHQRSASCARNSVVFGVVGLPRLKNSRRA